MKAPSSHGVGSAASGRLAWLLSNQSRSQQWHEWIAQRFSACNPMIQGQKAKAGVCVGRRGGRWCRTARRRPWHKSAARHTHPCGRRAVVKRDWLGGRPIRRACLAAGGAGHSALDMALHRRRSQQRARRAVWRAAGPGQQRQGEEQQARHLGVGACACGGRQAAMAALEADEGAWQSAPPCPKRCAWVRLTATAGALAAKAGSCSPGPALPAHPIPTADWARPLLALLCFALHPRSTSVKARASSRLSASPVCPLPSTYIHNRLT